MQCHECQTELVANAKFCPECGAKQQRTCPTCSSVVGQSANFCGNCGLNLNTEAKNAQKNQVLQTSTPALQPRSAPVSIKTTAPVTLPETSFVVLSTSLGTVADVSENSSTGAGHATATVQLIKQQLKERSEILVKHARNSHLINANYSYLLYILDMNGGGFMSTIKEPEDPVNIFVKLEDIITALDANFRKYTDTRIDVCLISTYFEKTPEIEDFSQNLSELSCETESGIELYIHQAEQNLVIYNAWDSSGDVEEGYLDDPEDDDWCRTPLWHKLLKNLAVKAPSDSKLGN